LRGVLSANAAAESLARVRTGVGELSCFCPVPVGEDRQISLVIRPEHIAIEKQNGAQTAGATPNWLSGRIKRETYLGEIVEYLVVVEGGEILVRTPFAGQLTTGDEVSLSFAPERTVALAQT
jgi:ABC-type Fe3+/spermidine/putrescine transport system ATPase subunit